MTTIRRMRWWDIESVFDLEQQCFPKDTWTIEQFWQELAQPTRRYFVAVDEDQVHGYAGAFILAPDSDVQTIAVDPRRRGEGIAHTLIERLLTSAQHDGASAMILEVRADNDDALRLYRSLDFEDISRRRAYYPDGADAVIMRRRPIGAPEAGK